LALDNCREAGTLTSGSLRMAIISIGGTANNPVLTADATITDFVSTEGNVSERSNGRFRVTVDESNPASTAVTLLSDNMSAQRLVGGQLVASRTLTNLSLREVINDTTGQSTATSAFVATGNFPGLGEGSFQVETLQDVITPGGAARPSTGRIRITGAANATIAATVVPTGVQLEIDRDGNGTVDVTRVLTWAEVDRLVGA
jgi:hypothetical protein